MSNVRFLEIFLHSPTMLGEYKNIYYGLWQSDPDYSVIFSVNDGFWLPAKTFDFIDLLVSL